MTYDITYDNRVLSTLSTGMSCTLPTKDLYCVSNIVASAQSSAASNSISANRIHFQYGEYSGYKAEGSTLTLLTAQKMCSDNIIITYQSRSVADNCVIFSSHAMFSLTYTLHNRNANNWDGSIYYSTDGTNWSTWTYSSGSTMPTIAAAAHSDEYKIYMYGEGNSTLNSVGNLSCGFLVNPSNNNYIDVTGNLNCLLQWDNPPTTLTTQKTFYSLFGTAIETGDTSGRRNNNKFFKPDHVTLPAATLTSNCYGYLFHGTGITTPPVLNAKNLAASCYTYMFAECGSLTSAPALPAITLANYCYAWTFYNCTKLKTTPALPAPTLSEGCYHAMFFGCTGLKTNPNLPAETLAAHCYFMMFKNCTGLVNPTGKLPATTIYERSYCQMFMGCTNLQSPLRMEVTTLGAEYSNPTAEHPDDWGCCEAMYQDCTSMYRPCYLFAKNLTPYCYRKMFLNRTWKMYSSSSSTYGWYWQIPYMEDAGTQGTDWNDQMVDSAHLSNPYTAPVANTMYYIAYKPA